jgi:hypothetical protein
MATIFTTPHGSRLYGFAREDSDYDRYTVTDSLRLKARQTVVRTNGGREIDHVRIGFNGFLIKALGGSHQSVEALFSPLKDWNEEFEYLKPFIDNMVVCGAPVYAKYERTIKSFCFGDFKRRRHAVRLSLNLAALREVGRFNPIMDSIDREYCEALATNMEGEPLWRVLMGED